MGPLAIHYIWDPREAVICCHICDMSGMSISMLLTLLSWLKPQHLASTCFAPYVSISLHSFFCVYHSCPITNARPWVNQGLPGFTHEWPALWLSMPTEPEPGSDLCLYQNLPDQTTGNPDQPVLMGSTNIHHFGIYRFDRVLSNTCPRGKDLSKCYARASSSMV